MAGETVQPVYAAPPPVVVTQTTTTHNNSMMREAIPAFVVPYAVVLAIINFILPGIGTIIAGFSVLWCGNVGQSGGSRVATCCINIGVGLLQLFLVVFVVGWIWSWIWGYAFIASSVSDGTKTTTKTTVVQPGVSGHIVHPQPVELVYTETSNF